MSKELVVSSNRHETRVALLEDDQVVEIYYQREKEYSLAGSIHKGRVTRVLPGMQSAFVDIGLDRDAFLYVSDFFEDNEEYDKVVTDAEDKVLRLDKGSAAAGTPAAAVTAAPASEEAAAAPAPAPDGQPAPPVFEARTEQREFRDPDRRGHRSRRRRSRGGRGIPESKYFSPSARPRQDSAPAESVTTEEGEEDFAVLPGESLAKYGTSEAGAEVGEPIAELPNEETAEPLAEEPSALVAADQEETAREGDGATRDPAPAEAALEPCTVVVEELLAPESVAPAELAQAVEEAGEPAEGVEPPAETVAGAPVDTELGPATAATGEEGAEAARIATSLTATLREQGPRYLHRMSRRMRRKMRASGAVPGAMERSSEIVREVQAPEVRAEARPEPPRAPRPERSGQPSISDLLREGQEIIVQIAKEPLGQKGARITSHIALPGRFLVYMPTVDHIGVSRKIPSDEERTRLKRVLQANRSGMPGGFIVRTAGDGRTEDELRADMLFLYNMWLDIRQKAEKKAAPTLIHHDLDVVQRILRDQLTAAYKTIWVDNEEEYENVVSFVQRFQPALVNRVKLYTRSTPIFDEFGVTQELEKALRPKVWLKSGGYIVINQTEALVAIDINTGKYVGKSNRLEDTIVKTNTDAVKEIVRQIRLRDLGGIIVVDFIDMDERKNRQKVMQALEEAMRADRAPYKILQFNDFGLVAITRKRVKQSLERTLCSPCPYCDGAGYVKSVQTVVGEILQEAQKVAPMLERGDVTLRVNPEVAKLLKSNKNDYLQELEQILGRTVLVKSDQQMHQEKFDLA
jgi:ribonuclease G